MNDCRQYQGCRFLRANGRTGCEQAIFEHDFLLFDRRPAQLGDLGGFDTAPEKLFQESGNGGKERRESPKFNEDSQTFYWMLGTA